VEKCLSTWSNGERRDSIRLSEMQEMLWKSAFNQESGLQYSSIISRYCIGWNNTSAAVLVCSNFKFTMQHYAFLLVLLWAYM